LADALRQIAMQHEVFRSVESMYGTKYVVDGTIEGPAGHAGIVRTVWIVESEGDAPRLVTAYPT
jgi:hypothetical protein